MHDSLLLLQPHRTPAMGLTIPTGLSPLPSAQAGHSESSVGDPTEVLAQHLAGLKDSVQGDLSGLGKWSWPPSSDQESQALYISSIAPWRGQSGRKESGLG